MKKYFGAQNVRKDHHWKINDIYAQFLSFVSLVETVEILDVLAKSFSFSFGYIETQIRQIIGQRIQVGVVPLISL